MKKLRHKITPDQLEQYAWEYINECINHKSVKIPERHLPTIAYFLKIWLPVKGKPTLCRQTYYNWLRSEQPEIMDTIKNIEGYFNALAIDIVANEGKGIFYAKNKLGMSDRPDPDLLDPITTIRVVRNEGIRQFIVADFGSTPQPVNEYQNQLHLGNENN
jgi:hypothetical protein